MKFHFSLYKLLLVSLCLWALQNAKAQPTNNILGDVVMPAPNAAALGKYADIPVSYFSGVPNISVPIYTVQEGPLSLPISLSYHASGIKVGEPASWVGMGWSLNAGGVITRTVMGLPDENGGYYTNGGSLVKDSLEIIDVADGTTDSEPDLFTFNVGGYTGKFLIDTSGTPFLMPKQDIRISFTYNQNRFVNFTITAPNGIRYIFGNTGSTGYAAIEQMFAGPASLGSFSDYSSSWYLVRIETHDGKRWIKLEYEDEEYGYKMLSSCYFTDRITSCNGDGGITTSGCNGRSYPGTTNTYYNEMSVQGKRLKKITTSAQTAEVTFTPFTDSLRKDLESSFYSNFNQTNTAYRLDKIEVSEGTYCSSWKFSYNHYESANPSTTKPETYRLRLTQVQQKACDGSITIPPYRFKYHGPSNSNGTPFLPSRMSKAIDHWGFYNGSVANESSEFNIPYESVPYGGSSYSKGSSYREASPDSMKFGVLDKVVYPTGGVTYFSYEANNSNRLLADEERLLYLENCDDFAEDCCGAPDQSGTFTFVDTHQINYANIELYLIGNSGRVCDPDPGIGDPDCFSCEDSLHHAIEVFAWDINAAAAVGDTITFNLDSSQQDVTVLCPLDSIGSFEPGKPYRFTLKVINGRGSFELNTDYTQTIHADRPVGGLRVAEIRVSPDSIHTNNDIIRTFKYQQAADTSKSSGILRKTPNYAMAQSFSVPGGTGWYVHFQGTSVTPLSDFQGVSIGYSRVEEFFNGNGKRIYNYHMSADPSDATFPLSPSLFDPRVSNLSSSATYSEAGTKIDSLNNTPKNYSYQQLKGKAYKVRDLNITCLVGGGELGGTEVRIILDKEYIPRTDFYYLTKVEQEMDGVSTTTHFTYDSQDYAQPKSSWFVNSDGDTTKTEYQYVYNLGNGAVKDVLLDDYYLILPPLRDSTKVDDTQVSGSAREYAFYDDNGLPTSTTSGNIPYINYHYAYEMTWDGSTPTHEEWDTIATLHKVDTSNGLPLELSQRGWEDESGNEIREEYTWAGNNLIASRKFQDFEWRYSYHSGTNLVDSIIDMDGQFVRYEYDKLMRLDKTRARENNVITDYSYDYRVDGEKRSAVTSSTTFAATDSSSLINRSTVQYIDGIGRPFQTIEKAYSPGAMDIVRETEYDKYSRPFKVYEPFESGYSDGSYVDTTGIPYTLTQYEASPLNRAISVTPPNWYATTTAYGTNASIETIAGVSYDPNELRLTTITDPNSNKTLTYVDKKGRTLMVKRTDVTGLSSVKTQYLFDDKDRISKVLPPDATTSDTDLIYSYTYDHRDNILTKKIPDQSAITYKYNIRNLMTYMQDGNMADQGRWLHTQYDDYGRAIESGFVNSTPGSGGEKINFVESLTKTCYDGCDFVGSAPDIYLGKVRRSETRILGTPDWLQTTFTYDDHGRVSLSESNHHLNIGNLQADSVVFKYDFADNITYQNRLHHLSDGRYTRILEKMAYDHSGRLKRTYHQVDGATDVVLSDLNYTAKDQILEKNIGKAGSSFLQSLDYAYLDNGFLTTINQPTLGGSNIALGACPPELPAPGAPSGSLDNNNLFYLELHYDQPHAFLSDYRQYNGNISQINWRVRGRERQAFGYYYDYLDRLQWSVYGDLPDTGNPDWNNDYSTVITYDERGNIEALQRSGYYWDGDCWVQGNIDLLDYEYYESGGKATNRLKTVSEYITTSAKDEGFKAGEGGDYTYDSNGNMVYDPNKDMDILYNYLNLPKRIEIEDCKFIEFLYDASGTKLRKTLKEGAMVIRTHDYLGGLEYTNDSLEAIYHSEGRVYFENGTSRYEYNLTDHLGNTRLTFTDKDGDGMIEIFENADSNEVLSESHYYPFGMQMNGTWMSNPGRSSKYRYNNKELNEDFGLDWYAYGARYYDPVLGRFTGVDPISDEFPHVSTYNYAENEPIGSIDLHGLQKVSIHLIGAVVSSGNGKDQRTTFAVSATVDQGQNNRINLAGSLGRYGFAAEYNSRSGSDFSPVPAEMVNQETQQKITTAELGTIGVPDALAVPAIYSAAETLKEQKDENNSSVENMSLTIGADALKVIASLVDSDQVRVGLGYDGSKGVGYNEKGELYLRKFTTTVSLTIKNGTVILPIDENTNLEYRAAAIYTGESCKKNCDEK